MSREPVVRSNVTYGPGDLAPGPPAGIPRGNLRLAAEAIAAGLAASGTLCWLGACAVASFRPYLLFLPYWWAIPWLRTDTCGAIAFVVTAICLVITKYLRLGRPPGPGWRQWAVSSGPGVRLAVAVAETATILSAAIVAYLSVNAVTHPQTLAIQATHFASWPTEGTLRVLALAVCAGSVGVLRFLRARSATGR